MKTITRRSSLVGIAALALPVPSVDAATEDARPVFVPLTQLSPLLGDLDTMNAKLFERHEADVWVYEHRDNLPADYDDLDRLPLKVRQAVLKALPVAIAVDLLLERIQRSADADPEITDEQRAVLADAYLTVTPEWAAASNEERETMCPDGGFWERARSAFTDEDWRRIFGRGDGIHLWGLGRHLALVDCAGAVGW
jgi:hypothetical protein